MGVLIAMLASFWFGNRDPFLPSPEYLARFQVIIVLFTVFAGAVGSILNLLFGFDQKNQFTAATSGFLVSAIFTYSTLTLSLPKYWTSYAGQEGTLAVTVVEPIARAAKSCRVGRVTISSVSPMLDEVCGVSDNIRGELNNEDKLILVGRVSNLGIFYRDTRLGNTR